MEDPQQRKILFDGVAALDTEKTSDPPVSPNGLGFGYGARQPHPVAVNGRLFMEGVDQGEDPMRRTVFGL